MAGFGLYGKHPAFGDFVTSGLETDTRQAWEDWLNATLPKIRDRRQDAWEGLYDAMTPLRFWLGSAQFVDGPVTGILAASRDKVGRRFPLVVMAQAPGIAAPVTEPDQSFHAALEAYVSKVLTKLPPSPKDIIERLPVALPETGVMEGDTEFWAARPDADVAGLLVDVAQADHARSCNRRSYWWAEGNAHRASVFHAVDGWPDDTVLEWLMTGLDPEGVPQ